MGRCNVPLIWIQTLIDRDLEMIGEWKRFSVLPYLPAKSGTTNRTATRKAVASKAKCQRPPRLVAVVQHLSCGPNSSRVLGNRWLALITRHSADSFKRGSVERTSNRGRDARTSSRNDKKTESLSGISLPSNMATQNQKRCNIAERLIHHDRLSHSRKYCFDVSGPGFSATLKALTNLSKYRAAVAPPVANVSSS